MAEFSSLLLRNEMRGMPLIGEFFSFHNFPLLFLERGHSSWVMRF